MIFIGSIYPQEMLNDIIEEGSHADFAANTFQSGILEGLARNYESVKLITSPVTSPYPKSKHLIYKKDEGELVLGKRIPMSFTGFVNLPIVKLFSEYVSVKRRLKSLLEDNDTVYIYALHSPFLLATYSLKKKIAKVCVIVPDLPDHMSHNRGYLRRLLKGANKRLINMCLRQFDYHVLFSRFMEPELPIVGKKWITVEGMYSPSIIPVSEKESKHTILYTGIISSQYGVFDLIKAFHQIEGNDYQLWLCGSCREEIAELEDYTHKDSRIQYLGMLQKDQVRELQTRATLLVNPRHSHEEFTKYSFPSKTMEYMASGTPTLMCKLPAIPEEYNEYLFYFEDESIEGFKNKIVEVCNMDKDSLYDKSKKAREFILKEKNCYAQAKRIYDMVES